jgi:A/G-specific adenine glycosylase
VISRLNGLSEPASDEVEALVLQMMPQGRSGDFAQAMMDLGATICRPKAPLCETCPLAGECAARALGTPEAFPVRKIKADRPHRHGTAWWIERAGTVWLVRRPASGLLGGMAALPGCEWTAQPPPEANAALGTVRHVFTHFSLDLRVERRASPVGDGWWQPIETLDESGLPTLYRRAAAVALHGAQARAAA